MSKKLTQTCPHRTFSLLALNHNQTCLRRRFTSSTKGFPPDCSQSRTAHHSNTPVFDVTPTAQIADDEPVLRCAKSDEASGAAV